MLLCWHLQCRRTAIALGDPGLQVAYLGLHQDCVCGFENSRLFMEVCSRNVQKTSGWRETIRVAFPLGQTTESENEKPILSPGGSWDPCVDYDYAMCHWYAKINRKGNQATTVTQFIQSLEWEFGNTGCRHAGNMLRSFPNIRVCACLRPVLDNSSSRHNTPYCSWFMWHFDLQKTKL